MITSDLDDELARSVGELAASEGLPAGCLVTPAGTWRPLPSADPCGYATAGVFEIARLAGREPAPLAVALAGSLRAVPWIQAAELTGDGYLTVTVTRQALALSAARMAAAGLDCASSATLRGTNATVRPWPDLPAAPTWQAAWEDHAAVMTGRIAQAAGATPTITSEWERAVPPSAAARNPASPVKAAVAYLGVGAVRYRLARTMPGAAGQLEQIAMARSRQADPYYAVQHAHADAASTLRWAAELGLAEAGPQDPLGDLLAEPAERELLGLLSFLPVRVAAAARRLRPDELPRYLEDVAQAWSACRQSSPALPFGGQPAGGPELVAARLLLADAVRAVLAAGLALTGVTATDRM
jgi:arginyl-tRNA synthetase